MYWQSIAIQVLRGYNRFLIRAKKSWLHNCQLNRQTTSLQQTNNSNICFAFFLNSIERFIRYSWSFQFSESNKVVTTIKKRYSRHPIWIDRKIIKSRNNLMRRVCGPNYSWSRGRWIKPPIKQTQWNNWYCDTLRLIGWCMKTVTRMHFNLVTKTSTSSIIKLSKC